MISTDRPPVPDRALPDRDALRYATLLAARQATRRPRRRRTSFVLALVTAALVATVLVGVLRSVHPTPQVAGPLPSATAGPPSPAASVTPLPAHALATDRGPASSAEIRAAARRCVTSDAGAEEKDQDDTEVARTVMARRVSDGTMEATAVVLELTDDTTVSCLTHGETVMSAGVDQTTADADHPAVVVGGIGVYWTVLTDSELTDRTAAVLRVAPVVRTVDVVTTGEDGVQRRFRAEPHDGWVYVPVTAHRPVPKLKDVRSANLDLVITAYDADGRSLPVLR